MEAGESRICAVRVELGLYSFAPPTRKHTFAGILPSSTVERTQAVHDALVPSLSWQAAQQLASVAFEKLRIMPGFFPATTCVRLARRADRSGRGRGWPGGIQSVPLAVHEEA